jgi:rhodanese-related sulfurtransferase
MMVATITRDELQMKIARGDKFTLAETLSAENYHQAHLPGAINLPPDQVEQLAPTLFPDKSAEIVVYCASIT